ncbi:hypothetical Protein YC6258_02535 [Gynuella sunshinyii YC6258]|uniref:Uncharacterized protein n=1 Tax=Gynuella sunshinyii YC6258 TaxID=1445510 RepID=A0A0C5VMK5_9GAMM|nr:hypothetical Protein YC6258_02535 [Gynuella sunshinyii YC6258]
MFFELSGGLPPKALLSNNGVVVLHILIGNLGFFQSMAGFDGNCCHLL